MKRFFLLFLFSALLVTSVSTKYASAPITEIRVVNPETHSSVFQFYTNTTSVGARFNVTLFVDNVTELYIFQTSLKYNSSVLDATRAWIPEDNAEYVFFGRLSVHTGPNFYYDDPVHGTSVLMGSTLIGDVSGFDGTGLLAIIEFEIIDEPKVGEAISCSLNINNVNTFFLDSSYPQRDIDANKIDGHYGYTWVPTQVRESVHNLDTGLNYTTIQEAIDANETKDGHTIFVEEGIYYEHLVVNKAVSLIGQNRQTTIIDGNMTEDVVRVTQDSVDITGFTVQRSGRILFNAGISLSNMKHCDIAGNRIVNNFVGIYGSPKNTSMSNNIIINNHVGIDIHGATYNIISENCLVGNNCSLHLYNANSNTIFENDMTNNWRSITLGYSRNNRLYHNRIFNNTEPILILASGYANFWDDGHSSGGNYWSDYNGSDSNNDGIGDTPYVLDGNNTDNYPLMGHFSSFNTSLGKHVDVISNSTIEDFEYFESNSTIKLYVSGEEGFGFCRVSIPNVLMNVSSISVIIDDGLTPALYHNYTLYDNDTHRWIYFAYEHSIHKIDIIPELSSLIMLSLLMIATLLAVIVYRRKDYDQWKYQYRKMGECRLSSTPSYVVSIISGI